MSSSRHTKKTYHFHNALKKYSIEEFSWEVLAYASSIEELNHLEEHFIKEYNSIDCGFNIRNGGKNKTHSEESKKRMSEAQRKAHERRRAEGRNTFVKTRKTSGWKWTKEQKENLKPVQEKLRMQLKNKTWKVINGKRVWFNKEDLA